MIVAHLSDLHLMAPGPIAMKRLLSKRFSGWVNLRLRRSHQHQRWVAEAVARELRALHPDHVVLTGDVSNLSLESEFEVVRRYLRGALGLSGEQLSMVPGNHDSYTRGAHRQSRFERYFGEHLSNDLPGASGVLGLGRYPYVRLRGPLALIGLSTAIPRPPLVASGAVGKRQRLALHSLLHHRMIRQRTAVLLQHHPWHPHASLAKQTLEGLLDAEEERAAFTHLNRGLLLHGHLHRFIHRTIPTAAGHLDAIGAGSASFANDARGGFNLYEIDASGSLSRARAWRLRQGDDCFAETALPDRYE